MQVQIVDSRIVLDFDAEIAEGSKWLSEQDPRWFDKIHLDELKLESTVQCVLGQLAMRTFKTKIYEAIEMPYTGYDAVLALFDKDSAWAYDHGFNVDVYRLAQVLDQEEDDLTDPEHPHSRWAWETLTRGWNEEVMRLRDEAAGVTEQDLSELLRQDDFVRATGRHRAKRAKKELVTAG